MYHFYLPNIAQIVVLLATLLALGIYWDVGVAAWLSGSVLTIVINTWFTFRVVSIKKIVDTKRFLLSANRGIVEKYCLAVSGFAVIFIVLKPQYPLLVFLGCIEMYITHMVVSAFMQRQR